MKQQVVFWGGVSICLALAGYFGFLIYSSLQSAGVSTTQLPTIVTLDEKTLLELRRKNLNGDLPLRYTAPAGVQNPQPF